MIGKLGKVSITFFHTNPRYWTNNHIFAKISHFLRSSVTFCFFPQVQKSIFRRIYSTGVEISSVKFSEWKLMMFVDIHNKYLELTLITYDDIQKVKLLIFFDCTVGKTYRRLYTAQLLDSHFWRDLSFLNRKN